MEDWKTGNHKIDCKDLQLTQKEVDESVANSNPKTLENLREGKDAEFRKFQRVTGNFPKQILRYTRWPSWKSKHSNSNSEEIDHNNSSSSPSVPPPILWMSKKAKRLSVPPPVCPKCGSERDFEFQIVPQILHFLKSDLDLDFDSILVYTCVASCGGGGGAMCEEFALVI